MKIPFDVIKFMNFLSDFAKNHAKYDLGNFDISLTLFPDLSYYIDIDFVNFNLNYEHGISINIKKITIQPERDLPIEDWIINTNLYSVKKLFTKWISENIEMFDGG